MFYFGTMGRNCQVHLLKNEVLGGGGAYKGTFCPHLCLHQRLAQSWLPAENKESARWKSGKEVMNVRQQAKEEQMNLSFLSESSIM